MSRILKILSAVAVTTMFGSTVALAQPQGPGYYAATPVEAPSKSSLITRDTVWKLHDGAFTASKQPERDIILCQLVAQRVGKLKSFAVAGTSFDDASLAACNAKAN